ncbi:MAG: dienelactone hydrolase family protein [Nitrospinota bacterium]|nr:dienelactone hydrolase family protein [Nitrospinota bacterium]
MRFRNKIVVLVLFIFHLSTFSSYAVTSDDYEKVLEGSKEVTFLTPSEEDGEKISGLLYTPNGKGPFPAVVALHGAGGIFPYQLWWAKTISKLGYVVLFVDHYCKRKILCNRMTDDSDRERGDVMRDWQQVPMRQRMMDAKGAFQFLAKKKNVLKNKIGSIGWSWGGSVMLFKQRYKERFPLPFGGFKATIAFYPNFKYLYEKPMWQGGEKFKEKVLILYGLSDELESKESYDLLLKEEGDEYLKVVGYPNSFRKFDELGGYREKYHPAVGDFAKEFNKKAFEGSLNKVVSFFKKNLTK